MNAARSFRGLCVWAIATVVFVFSISSPAQGQERKSRGADYAPGDSVEIRQGNKWQAGAVVETTRAGLVKVQLAGAPASRVVRVPKQFVGRAEVVDYETAADAPRAGEPLPTLHVCTDSTGQHKVEAEFVEAADGKVTLRKKDGSLAVLPLERLCEEDRALIASLADDQEPTAVRLGNWQTITALGGRLSIQLPGKPTKTEQVSQIAEGPVTFEVYKYSARGRFWNFHVVTYPAAVIEAATDKIEFLKRIGNGVMRGKAGSEQLSLATLKESAYPAIRLEYRYPSGKNSAGEYGSGQAIHELYLIGNQVCWAFVDVLDVAREVESDKVTAQIKHFFASLVLPKE